MTTQVISATINMVNRATRGKKGKPSSKGATNHCTNETVGKIYGQRSRAELYYHEDFLALAERHANFRYIPALSDEPAGSGWEDYRGFVHEAAVAHFGGDFCGHKAYLCGPPPMIDACITALMQGRLFENDNVRLVAATNADLSRAVAEGGFRSDLFYRLNVYPVTIPPLRERTADIPALAEAMIGRFQTLHDKRVAGITGRAMHALKRHTWPGNVRELENVLERGVILAPHNGMIEVQHLFLDPAGDEPRSALSTLSAAGTLEEHDPAAALPDLPAAVLDAGLELERFERELLQRAVERAEGNLAAAARLLGITRPQLDYRLKKAVRSGN